MKLESSKSALQDLTISSSSNLLKFGKAITIFAAQSDVISCANPISRLRYRKDLISVFLSGNLEARIKEIQEEKGFSYDEAEEFVEHTEDCRVAYHKYYTDLTWGNADDYDICLDTVRLGVEETASLIEQYVSLI